MSTGRERTGSRVPRRPTGDGDRSRRPSVWGHGTALPRPTRGELGTVFSAPALVLFVHFAVQPLLPTWPRFGYVRYDTARAAAPERIAPEPFVDHVWWWHEFTRVSHALVHDPSGFHAHALGNAALITFAAAALLVLLTALGRRRLFALCYWELVVAAPIVGSFAFDLFGTTPHGYGASTVGFAFLGVVAITGLFVLLSETRTLRSSSSRADGRVVPPHWFLVVLLAFVALVVAVDLVEASPATPVHQAGVGFGMVVGMLVTSLGRHRREAPRT